MEDYIEYVAKLEGHLQSGLPWREVFEQIDFVSNSMVSLGYFQLISFTDIAATLSDMHLETATYMSYTSKMLALVKFRLQQVPQNSTHRNTKQLTESILRILNGEQTSEQDETTTATTDEDSKEDAGLGQAGEGHSDTQSSWSQIEETCYTL
jgi:hypothetical protein